MMTNKKPDERLDDLQVKGYEIIQKPGRFCFGMDAVLLSSYAKVIDIVTGDIKEASHIFGNDSYEVIVSNPPYMIGEHGLKNDNEALYIARHEALCTLDDLLRESAKVLKMKGRFYMVHRPFRLPEIFTKMCNYGIEPKRMRLVHPYADAHSLHERRGVYGRSTEIVRDEIKGELYVRNIISVCNSDRQPGGHDISLYPYFKRS